MIKVYQGHRCKECKGPVARLIDINRDKYGYDYEPLDEEEYYIYRCVDPTTEGCKLEDCSDEFYYWDVEFIDEHCPKCESKNLKAEYFDYFSGNIEVECEDCKHTYSTTVD